MKIFKIENNNRILALNLNRINYIKLATFNGPPHGKFEDADTVRIFYDDGFSQLVFKDPKEAKETYDKIVEAMEQA